MPWCTWGCKGAKKNALKVLSELIPFHNCQQKWHNKTKHSHWRSEVHEGHTLLKSSDRAIGDSSQGRITKKSMARKLAEPDIGYYHLKTLFTTKGERGFLPFLPICQQAVELVVFEELHTLWHYTKNVKSFQRNSVFISFTSWLFILGEGV